MSIFEWAQHKHWADSPQAQWQVTMPFQLQAIRCSGIPSHSLPRNQGVQAKSSLHLPDKPEAPEPSWKDGSRWIFKQQNECVRECVWERSKL